jgi:hypothetical protein
MSASPATGESIFFTAAAARLIALSKASGPSSTAPEICPRSAILQSAAASSVPGIFGFTVSTAERMATSGMAAPSARSRSTAFCTMSALVGRSGAMLMAASVMKSGLW